MRKLVPVALLLQAAVQAEVIRFAWGTGPARKRTGGFKAALNELGKTGATHAGH